MKRKIVFALCIILWVLSGVSCPVDGNMIKIHISLLLKLCALASILTLWPCYAFPAINKTMNLWFFLLPTVLMFIGIFVEARKSH